MNKIKATIMALFGIAAGAAAQCSSPSTRNVDVAEFEKIIHTDSVQLLDSRTPGEYSEYHIHGAMNINVQDSTFEAQALERLDKNRPVAVYCRSGKRSALACSILEKKGYKTTNLLGGIIAWTNKKKPVEAVK